MPVYLQAFDAKNEELFGNIPYELYHLLEETSGVVTIDAVLFDKIQKVKRYFVKTEDAKLFILTNDTKYINSSKLFKELISMSLINLDSAIKYKSRLSIEHNTYIQELIHNLTSLNSYNIQGLFSLIPQRVLTQNINKQHETIKEIIVGQPNIAVTTLLKLIKHNLAMKVEFSVFEKTVVSNPELQKMHHSIREVVLSVLQIFIDEFEERKIIVSVDSTSKMLNIDYDALFVSLYYLLENAVKYCAKNTKFGIIFKEESDGYVIIFKMISARIEDHEKTKLFTKNFRAESAKALTSAGRGIGMNRILKTLRMNNAEIEIFPRVTNYTKEVNNIKFEHNEFKIKFIGQQDWFKISEEMHSRR